MYTPESLTMANSNKCDCVCVSVRECTGTNSSFHWFIWLLELFIFTYSFVLHFFSSFKQNFLSHSRQPTGIQLILRNSSCAHSEILYCTKTKHFPQTESSVNL